MRPNWRLANQKARPRDARLPVRDIRLRPYQRFARDDHDALVIGATGVAGQRTVQFFGEVRTDDREPAVAQLEDVGAAAVRRAAAFPGGSTKPAGDCWGGHLSACRLRTRDQVMLLQPRKCRDGQSATAASQINDGLI